MHKMFSNRSEIIPTETPMNVGVGGWWGLDVGLRWEAIL